MRLTFNIYHFQKSAQQRNYWRLPWRSGGFRGAKSIVSLIFSRFRLCDCFPISWKSSWTRQKQHHVVRTHTPREKVCSISIAVMCGAMWWSIHVEKNSRVLLSTYDVANWIARWFYFEIYRFVDCKELSSLGIWRETTLRTWIKMHWRRL